MSAFARFGMVRMVSAAAAVALFAAAPASAHSNGSGGAGGAGYAPPEVTGVSCDTPGDDGSCAQGTQVRLKGENLTDADSVVFLGHKGTTDDRKTAPVKTSAHRIVVRIPSSAQSGRVRVFAADAEADGPKIKVAKASSAGAATPTTTASDGGVFPIRGKHDYGTEVNRFGGGRNHQGQDVFANCGKRIVAALAGEVTLAKFQSRAGNYAVIKADDGTSQVYMHMLEPAIVNAGDRVEAGQQIGQVGETGRATGCHLHFELWTAPGWYEGGSAIDPLPTLKGWDAAS